MKKLLLLLLVLLLIPSGNAFAGSRVRAYDTILGDGANKLQGQPATGNSACTAEDDPADCCTGSGTGNCNELVDGDYSVVIESDGDEYWYVWDDDGTGATSSPTVIRSTDYADHGNQGTWLLTNKYVVNLVSTGTVEGATLNVSDAAVDSISADGATLEVGDSDEETHVQADGLPDSDDTYSCGMVLYLTAGNAVKQWDLVAMQADGKVDMANASMNTIIGFAVEETNDGWPAADTETIGVCLLGSGGVIRNDGWTGHTAGEIVFVVDAGGTDGLFDPADEIDLEDGDYWVKIGVMQEEDIIIFPVPTSFTDDGS